MIARDDFKIAMRQKLRDVITTFEGRTLEQNPFLDRYLAASMLQKAIRRDEIDYAWQATSYLLENFPTYFWQRLPIVALEDIGVGDIDVTMMVILAATDLKLRVDLGGCHLVAFALVQTMCAATKDRSTDDLYDVVLRDPSLQGARVNWADQPRGLSNPLEGGVQGIGSRLVFRAGFITEIPASRLSTRQWLPILHNAAFSISSNAVFETSIAGFLGTRSVLAPMLLAVGFADCKEYATVDDDLLPTQKDALLPSWILGQHTRIGLDGFRRFARQSKRMRSLLNDVADGTVSKSKVVGGLVFRLDCGQLLHRRDWALAYDLKQQATSLGWGIPDSAVPEALSILMSEFDQLDACRAAALKEYLQ